MAEKAVQRFDHAGGGAPVACQRKSLRRLPSGMKISKNVGPSKAVDGLFRVPDHGHQMPSPAEELIENGILDGVRILELIDQDRTIARLQQALQGVVALLRQSLINPHKQVIEKKDLLLLFRLAKAIRHEMKEADKSAHEPDLQALIQPLGFFPKAIALLEKGMSGGLSTFFDRSNEFAAGEIIQGFRRRESACRRSCPLVQCASPTLNLLLPFGVKYRMASGRAQRAVNVGFEVG